MATVLRMCRCRSEFGLAAEGEDNECVRRHGSGGEGCQVGVDEFQIVQALMAVALPYLGIDSFAIRASRIVVRCEASERRGFEQPGNWQRNRC